MKRMSPSRGHDALPDTVKLAGLTFATGQLPQVVDRTIALADDPAGNLVVTPNVDFLVRARRQPAFQDLLESAALCVADGAPVSWLASRTSGVPVTRIAGVDLFEALCERAVAENLTISIVGGQPGLAEEAMTALRARYGEFRTGIVSAPTADQVHDPEYHRACATMLARHDRNIVAICLGSPKQEQFYVDLMEVDGVTPRGAFLGLGATVDFLAGRVPRAPRLVQRLGAEWLYRWLREPRRLAKRYLTDLAHFPIIVVAETRRARGGSR